MLVNRDSASASEIVAAALQDNGRAVVVGERTYGKGSVQKLFRLGPDQKTAVKLTTETYWRPSGKNIDRVRPEGPPDADEWGVKPDAGLEVPMTEEEQLRFDVGVEEAELVAGKPDVVAGFRPEPAAAAADAQGRATASRWWTTAKPFEDRAAEGRARPDR